MGALVLDPDEEEERAGDEPVVEHLQHRADAALRVQDEDAERHEAHVRDGGVRDELLQILLYRRHGGAVEDGDHGQHDDHRQPELRTHGKERQREAQKTVATRLQEDAGEDDRARGRRLDVGVGQPGVERDHRQLDRERESEREEDPELEVSGETPARREQLRQRERARALVAGREPDGDDGHEHEQRARKGEDHELERRVDATRAAPDADDEIHRHEHQLEHDVEEEEIERDEDADHADLEDEERRHE